MLGNDHYVYDNNINVIIFMTWLLLLMINNNLNNGGHWDKLR